MDNAKWLAAGIEYESGKNRFLGDGAMYEVFLKKYLNDASYSKAKESFASGDMDALFIAVHTLKGLAGNLSLIEVAKAASDITEHVRNKNYQGLEPLFLQLDVAQEKAIKAIMEA